MNDNTRVINGDCMIGMKDFPDKYFDLAIVDPEYGIGVNHNMGRRKGDRPSKFKPADWDKESVSKLVIDEIFRVSQNQIIWGANHFISKMPVDSSCWILWDKGFSEEVTFAQFEMAWTSFDGTCKKFDKQPNGHGVRIHPTQKPVALYKWLLKNYAKEGDKILDTHGGSMSSVIACLEMGFEITCYEKDPDYYLAAKKRIEQYLAQGNLFKEKGNVIFG